MDQNPAGAPNEPVISQPVASRPVEQPTVEVVKPLKKSKMPIVIVAVVLFLVAIGAAAAAIVILRPFASHDAVPAAISKLFSAGAPQNVKMTGTVTTYDNNKETEAPGILIDFAANMNNVTTENVVTASISAMLPGNQTFDFDVDEIHTKNNDLYLKLDGVAKLTDYSAVFDVIDDEWIKIQGSEFDSITSMLPGDMMGSCLIGAAGKLSEYGKNFVALYNENPFVEYSTADINIDAKKDQLYRLYFDSTKLTSFVNTIGNAGFANELMACAGELAVNQNVTEDELTEIVKNIPTIYVEIDDKDNFTRLYMTMASEDGLVGAIMDISFEYPTSPVVVEEPSDYIMLGEFLESLLSDFYNTEVVE